jgi:hypothetical protein
MIQKIRPKGIFRSAALLAFSLALAAYNGAAADTTSNARSQATPEMMATATAQSAPTAVVDQTNRHCWARQTGSARVSICASNYSASQADGSVSLTVLRGGVSSAAVSIDYGTSNGTAVSGTDFTPMRGTLKWAENDSTPRTITVPISNAKSFAGTKTFNVGLANPSSGLYIWSPGSARVSISGAGTAVEGSLELGDAAYSVPQNAGSLTVSVNRTGGSSGAISVGYASSNGTAVGGKDFTAASGVLKWADGDAAPKSFSIPISNATPFADTKTFSVALTSAGGSGAMMGTPSNAPVTIVGDKAAAVGSAAFGASSYSVVQNAGKVAVSVGRTGGSNGALSVAYTAKNGTAVAGTDFAATAGTVQWADGDASAKSLSIPVSNATPFSGTKSFTVALSSPSTGGAVSSPGTATVSIAGDAALPVGNISLSALSKSVAQNAGSVTVTVDRTGGSHGAISVTYSEVNGSAVAGTDFTETSGKLSWADGDAAPKSFSIPVSNAKPFSGSKSFTVDLSGITGGAALSNPTSAVVSITGDAAAAAGSVQLSSSGYTVSQSSGSVTATVNRTGGSSGAVTVRYAAANGTADAGTDFTASSGTLSWASGDAASKTFSVPVSKATPFSGSKNFTLALSSPTGGAALSSPANATVTINGSSVGATTWVYYNGVFNWGGDWSFAASPNYKDTAGGPIEGPYDIVVTSQQWGGWQPFVSANCQSNISQCFNTLPYKYLIFSAKPTIANQVFDVGFMSSGDTTDGVTIFDTSSYCSGGRSPAVGQWESCKIPLSAFKLSDTTVLKFWISDQSGAGSNHWYLDNVGFTAN